MPRSGRGSGISCLVSGGFGFLAGGFGRLHSRFCRVVLFAGARVQERCPVFRMGYGKQPELLLMDTGAGAVFSVFRSFDFDIAVLITFDSATYALREAREVPVAELETAGRHSAHVNGRLIRITAGLRLGVDVTEQFRAVASM